MLIVPRLKRFFGRPSIWIVACMLGGIAALHYFTPQTRLLGQAPFALGRHAVERIIFLVPVAGASFAFGQAGGLITLGLAVAIMLPRAFLISPYPADALLEVVAVAAVGYAVIWMIEAQEREKGLRQAAVLRLRAINSIGTQLTESLDLQQILSTALDKTLEVMDMEVGLVYLLDRSGEGLVLAAHKGIAEESAASVGQLMLGEGFCGRVAHTGELQVVRDSSQDPRLTRDAVRDEGLQDQIIVPLRSKGKVQGVMAVAARQERQFGAEEKELISAIGNEIGMAIENARLYENMRFYVQQVTQAQEDERKRIARELHDDTVQSLIAVSRRLEALAKAEPCVSSSEEMRTRVSDLQVLTDDVIRGVRRFSRDLRPSILDDLGLLPTLESLATAMGEDGVVCRLQVTGEKRRLSAEVELALFRIVQEALNNVRKHAGADTVTIVVEFSDSAVSIIVSDNGRGFEVPERVGDVASAGKLGLMGMHERSRLLGATLLIESEKGSGTKVTVRVPL